MTNAIFIKYNWWTLYLNISEHIGWYRVNSISYYRNQSTNHLIFILLQCKFFFSFLLLFWLLHRVLLDCLLSLIIWHPYSYITNTRTHLFLFSKPHLLVIYCYWNISVKSSYALLRKKKLEESRFGFVTDIRPSLLVRSVEINE
jgi:hypothetical protein